MTSKVNVTEITSASILNFPIKSFYSLVTGDCYTFYRQGHGITANAKDPAKSHLERLSEADFGSMYLLFDQALVTRSSNSILFFKIDEETGEWK